MIRKRGIVFILAAVPGSVFVYLPTQSTVPAGLAVFGPIPGTSLRFVPG
ncbi:MAG: hypothetical protein WA434_18640 [Candidatus Acidiferrales bacterium]